MICLYVYTEITEKRTSDDRIGPVATAGTVIGLLLIIVIITVITVVIVIIRKKTKNKKCKKGNKEFETAEESQDYIHMQTSQAYSLHKANTQEPEYCNLK